MQRNEFIFNFANILSKKALGVAQTPQQCALFWTFINVIHEISISFTLFVIFVLYAQQQLPD